MRPTLPSLAIPATMPPPALVGGRWLAVARATVPPLAFLAASLLLRSISFIQAVIDTDEGLYLVQAREWLRGGWPLVAVWDMHPIGAPALFAVALTVFGESIAAVRLLGAIFVAASAWALFRLVRGGGMPREVAYGAGLILIAFSLRLGGLASNTEILFAPFVIAAIGIGMAGARGALLRGSAPGWRALLLMGLAIGLALAIKPVVTPEGCLAFALLTFPALWRRVLPWPRFLAMATAYAGLCLLPTALFGLIYALRGDFAVFLDGSFLAPFRYAEGRLPWAEAGRLSLVAALILALPFGLALTALRRWLPRPGAGGRLARLGLLWFVAASVAIAGPGDYYPHYFLIWLAPLGLLAALGAWRLSRLARPPHARPAYRLIVAVVVLTSFLGAFVPRLERGIGFSLPDPVREVAAAIAEDLAPGEAIFVANYHPAVYFLVGAEIPTRFVFPAHLTGSFDSIADLDTDTELRRILGTQPRLIVVDRGWWWTMRPEAQALITATLEEGYEIASTVTEERGPVEIWRRR